MCTKHTLIILLTTRHLVKLLISRVSDVLCAYAIILCSVARVPYYNDNYCFYRIYIHTRACVPTTHLYLSVRVARGRAVALVFFFLSAMLNLYITIRGDDNNNNYYPTAPRPNWRKSVRTAIDLFT